MFGNEVRNAFSIKILWAFFSVSVLASNLPFFRFWSSAEFLMGNEMIFFKLQHCMQLLFIEILIFFNKLFLFTVVQLKSFFFFERKLLFAIIFLVGQVKFLDEFAFIVHLDKNKYKIKFWMN